MHENEKDQYSIKIRSTADKSGGENGNKMHGKWELKRWCGKNNCIGAYCILASSCKSDCVSVRPHDHKLTNLSR